MTPELNLWQRLLVELGFYVQVGERRFPGWSGSLMFYAFKCPKHGLVVDYIHGYDDVPCCPKCVDEKIRVIK